MFFLPHIYVAAISFFLFVSFFVRMLMYFATFCMLFFTRSLFAFPTVYICVVPSCPFCVSLSSMFCRFPEPDFQHLVSCLVYRLFVLSF